MPDSATLDIGGKQVEVTNLNKVFYPKTGFTKGEVIDYYIKISPVLLPHLHNGPLASSAILTGWKGFSFTKNNARNTARSG